MYTEQEYKEWLLSRISYEYETEEGNNRVIYTAGEYKAFAVFHDQEIIELMIVNSAGDNEFYLHFRLQDAMHAQELSEQMLDTLVRLKNRKGINILLSCSSGFTTTYFASQLNEAASLLKMDYHFDAVSFNRLYTVADQYDAVLLAPQEGYQYSKVKNILTNKTVIQIPGSVFGTYDVGRMLEIVKKEMDKNTEVKVKEEDIILHYDEPNPYRILVLGLIEQREGSICAYRIYDHGRKTLDKEVIKPSLRLSDIDDLMDYIEVRHKNIDVIGIAAPGVAFKGRLTNSMYGFDHTDLARHIADRIRIDTVVLNDVNAMTLGYAAAHDDCDNMSFVFQPRGDKYAGAGTMINGHLHLGHQHNAGQIGTLQEYFMPRGSFEADKPENAMKLVSIALHTCICSYAPEKIVLYSELTPDTEEIRYELSRSIDSSLIPEIIHTRELKGYILPGMMIRCLQIIKEHVGNPGRFHVYGSYYDKERQDHE